MQLKKLTEADEIPYDLLLLADETKKAIDLYIHNCDIYILKVDETNAIGVFALLPIDEDTIELKNIALHPSFQNKGLGSKMIGDIIELVSNRKIKTIIVGTPTIAKAQLNFYQKNGFVKYAIKENFFIEYYDEPIFEEGIQLKDMQMLKLVLQ